MCSMHSVPLLCYKCGEEFEPVGFARVDGYRVIETLDQDECPHCHAHLYDKDTGQGFVWQEVNGQYRLDREASYAR